MCILTNSIFEDWRLLVDGCDLARQKSAVSPSQFYELTGLPPMALTAVNLYRRRDRRVFKYRSKATPNSSHAVQ